MKVVKNLRERKYMTKTLKIIWWSSIKHLEEVCPPLPANKFIPSWYKNIHSSKIDATASNVKGCPSFPMLFSQGYVIPLWTDVVLRFHKKTNHYQWLTPDAQYQMESHSAAQLMDHLPENIKKDIAFILKPTCPWKLITPTGYSTLQLPMTYYFNPIFETLSGILPTDKWHQTNQQMLIKKSAFEKSSEITIPKGTPLATYIPFKREEYKYVISPQTEKLLKDEKIRELKLFSKFRRRLQELD